MDIINKILGFASSDAGQLLITALVGILSLKYGKHFSVTPEQAKKVLDKVKDHRAPGGDIDFKALSKDVQRDIKTKLFSKLTGK